MCHCATYPSDFPSKSAEWLARRFTSISEGFANWNFPIRLSGSRGMTWKWHHLNSHIASTPPSAGHKHRGNYFTFGDKSKEKCDKFFGFFSPLFSSPRPEKRNVATGEITISFIEEKRNKHRHEWTVWLGVGERLIRRWHCQVNRIEFQMDFHRRDDYRFADCRKIRVHECQCQCFRMCGWGVDWGCDQRMKSRKKNWKIVSSEWLWELRCDITIILL